MTLDEERPQPRGVRLGPFLFTSEPPGGSRLIEKEVLRITSFLCPGSRPQNDRLDPVPHSYPSLQVIFPNAVVTTSGVSSVGGPAQPPTAHEIMSIIPSLFMGQMASEGRSLICQEDTGLLLTSQMIFSGVRRSSPTFIQVSGWKVARRALCQ